jgi:hypothetical protein
MLDELKQHGTFSHPKTKLSAQEREVELEYM